MTEYPVTFYRKGWDDLSDWILIESAECEAMARAAGFKHMNEFSGVVAEIQQISQNTGTPKRRGRPPKGADNGNSSADNQPGD